MHILLFPIGFILWYLAYDAKPIINDDVTLNLDEYAVNKKVLSENIKMMHEFIEFKYFKKVMKRNNNIIE